MKRKVNLNMAWIVVDGPKFERGGRKYKERVDADTVKKELEKFNSLIADATRCREALMWSLLNSMFEEED